MSDVDSVREQANQPAEGDGDGRPAQGGAAAPWPGRPCAGPILRACQRATGEIPGVVVEHEVTGQGVRVRCCPADGQHVVLRALRALGYQVWEDTDGDDEHGAAVVVTAWSPARLTARAQRLERAVAELERQTELWARFAVDQFRRLITATAITDDAAGARVLAEIGRDVDAQPALYAAHVSADVDAGDREGPMGEVRQLLYRVAAGELALRRAREGVLAVARTAIEQFRVAGSVGGEDGAAAERAVEATKKAFAQSGWAGACQAVQALDGVGGVEERDGWPAVAGIVEVCRRATAGHGDVGLRVQWVNEGLRVWLSSWPAQDDAVQGLRQAGYGVLEDVDAGGEQGNWCVVTGWDAAALRARLGRLKRAVRALEEAGEEWPRVAVRSFRELTATGAAGAADAVAGGAVAAAVSLTFRHVVGRVADAYMLLPVDERDRVRASGEIATLLDDVVVGELAVTWLRHAVVAASELAIEWFETLCEEPDTAAEVAAAEAVQVVTATSGRRAADGHHLVRGESPVPAVVASHRDFLVDLELVFDLGSAQPGLTKEQVVSGLQRLCPRTYGGWTPRELGEMLRRLGMFAIGLRRGVLPGAQADGLLYEDVVRARRVAAWAASD